MNDNRQFLIIKDRLGSTVGKIDTIEGLSIPKSLSDNGDLKIEEVPSRSELKNHNIDQSNLSNYEKSLLSDVYPIQESE